MSQAVHIPSPGVLEGCYPLGDKWHAREVKRLAVRKVMLEDRSYRFAAREAGASHTAVMDWVAETETRLQHIADWMQTAGANF